MRRESWAFLFYKGCKMVGMCLICALLLKKCLAVCLTLRLNFDARRRGRGGSNWGNLRTVWVRPLHVPGGVSAGAFPSQGQVQRVPVCLLVRGGLIVCVVAVAPGGACGRLPARAAARCGSCWHGVGVVLVVRSPFDLWMISPAERRCSVQHGRRSGCALLGMDAAGVGCCLCCHAGHGTMRTEVIP